MDLEHFLHIVLKNTHPIFEFIGVLIIFIGAVKALMELIKNRFDFGKVKTKILLGEALSLGLEFKLASEIIKTVLIRTIDEIIILAAVMFLRIVLSVFIHWEIRQTESGDHSHVAAKRILENKAD